MGDPEPNADLSSLTEALKKSKAIMEQAEKAGFPVPAIGPRLIGEAEKAAKTTIDSLIGREPDDAFLLQYLRDYQAFSSSVLAPVSRRYASTLYPGTDEAQARVAVGAIHPLYDPWTVGDDFIAQQLQGNERLANLYIRDTDPLSVLPYLVETDKGKSGWFSKAKDVAGDFLGRPLGKVAELLSWPADQVELWAGSTFIWNDISDPALRRVLARQTWDWGVAVPFSATERRRLRAADQKAYQIMASGLTGDSAAEEMERWLSSPEGRPSKAAMVGGFVGSMVVDPISLLLFLPIGKLAAKAGPFAGRIPRILGPGFSAFKEENKLSGWHAITEAIKAEELTWQGPRIWLPTKGPTHYLFSQTSNRYASDVSRQFALDLTKADLSIEDLSRLSEALIKAEVTPDVARSFGPAIFTSPQKAQYAQLVKKNSFSLLDKMLPTDPKARLEVLQILREVPPDEAASLLRVSAEAVLEASARDFYDDLMKIPTWMKRAQSVAAGQKLVMGVFTLGRPAFVALNVANNTMTFMWHSALHPVDMAKSLAGASFASTTGRLLKSTENIIKAVDAEPAAMIRNWASITSDVDALSLTARRALQTDTAADWTQALERVRKLKDFPARVQRPFQLRSLVAWPVSMAGGVDRWARIATGEFALRQQLHMTLAPRAILAGPLADFRTTLVDLGADPRVAEQAERKAVSALQYASIREGKPIFRREVSSKIVSDALQEMSAPGKGLSGTDIFIRWSMAHKGASGGLDSWLLMRDYLAETTRIDEVLSKLDDLTPVQRDSMLDMIEDEVSGFDRWQAQMTRTDPVLRETPSYVQATGATEEGIREAMEDNILHLDRLLAQTHWGEWKAGLADYNAFYKSVDGTLGLMEDLADIRRTRIQLLIDGADVKGVRARWPLYFQKRDEVWEGIYQTTRKYLGERNVAAAKKLDAWYDNLKSVHGSQAEAIAKAVEADTPEAWVEAGSTMRKLFSKQSRQNASKRIFGIPLNNPPKNLTHVRPSAVLSDDIADLMQFTRQAIREGLGETPENYALGIARAGAATPGLAKEQIEGLVKLVDETATNLVAVRQQVIGQAQALVDFVMLNYNRQYGIDSLMQVFFPYEFFPTRSVAHWGMRMLRHPTAFAKLAQFITRPAEYAQYYGMPQRLQFAIPIPLPFMGELVNKLPVVGGKVATNQWGPVYWIDPMAILFPFTYDMRDQFSDEQARSTPMGKVMDWAENAVPMGFSPFAKIIGSESGMLDKDAWEYGLFRGGPFGISPSIVGRAAALWLQTGDDTGVPEEEQRNYTEGGFFGTDFLRRIFAVEPDRWDDYRTERAGAALIATGELIPGASRTEQRDQFYVAMETKSGPLWKKAQKYARSTQFLADLTGWAFMRITPVMEGELKIRMGERMLYQEAARRGELESFFEKYPEYEVYSTAVRGVSDPEAKEQAVSTNLYYQAVEKYVEGPYQLQLAQIDQMLDDLSGPLPSSRTAAVSFLRAGKATHPDETDAQAEYDSMIQAVQTGQNVESALRIARSHLDAHQNALRPEVRGTDRDPYPSQPEKNEQSVEGFTQVLSVLSGPSLVVTSDTQKQKTLLIAARKSIRDEQSSIRDMLDAAFGDREQELSLFRDPKDRALMGVESLYYDIPALMGGETEFTEEEVAGLKAAMLRGLSGDPRIWESLSQEMLIKAKGRTDLPEDKVDAARELLLSRFPAYDPETHSAQDWHDLTVASLQEKFGASIQIASAIQEGDYEKVAQIQTQRERDLNTLHTLARGRLTRFEVEAFLNRNKRASTPEEREFEEAEYVFDLWMSLVGEGSPLTNKQQAAVSEYFRQHPMIQKHFPSEAIDVRTLSVQGIVDILRRREIWSTYYDISDVDSQLDYMHSVEDELNAVNARLGLPKVTVIDPRPLPPEPLSGAWSGGDDFQGEEERQALITLAKEEGLSDVEIAALLDDWASETGQLTPTEIDKLIDMSDRRGY